MNPWERKLAVVTGASAGIGLATAQAFIREGLIVVGLARRMEKMEEDMKNIKGPSKFYASKCDITKQEDVNDTFEWIKKTFGTVNILINNAEVLGEGSLEDIKIEELQFVINVNLMGVIYCSRKSIKLMKQNGEDAHIININSVVGNVTPRVPGKNGNVYPATKFALRSLTETLTHELINFKIRVCNVSPGVVKTEIFEKADIDPSFLNIIPALNSEDVANSILHIIGTPPHVEITQLTIQPKGEHIDRLGTEVIVKKN